jgi:hypothetical protein
MVTEEQAKAAQEVAKTTGKFAEVAEKVGGFVEKIIGPACYEAGGVLTDWTRYFRYKNLLAIRDKVEALHASRKIEGRTASIPPKIAIPLLESASLEDDEILQEVWAKLIANSTDPNFIGAIHPGYIEIIKQMSPDEAVILNSFLKNNHYPVLFSCYVQEEYQAEEDPFHFQGRSPRPNRAVYQSFYELFAIHCKTLALKKTDDSSVYLDNLLRLRIVEVGHAFLGENRRRTYSNWESLAGKKRNISIPARDEFLRMTSFGQSFVAACIGKKVSSSIQTSEKAP